MMNGLEWLIVAALLVCVAGLGWHVALVFRIPAPHDRAPVRGVPRDGIIYAFTSGMMPWAKESTREHPLAYIRGILLHAGIFAALLVLALHPWLDQLPDVPWWGLVLLIGLGAANGITGLVVRTFDANLRRISAPDDYFSVFLVTLFQILAGAALLDQIAVAVFQIVSVVLLVYIPFGKIRHCVYFFFSRYYFGQFFGRRGVIGGRT